MCRIELISNLTQGVVGVAGILIGIFGLIIALIGGRKIISGLFEKRVIALSTYYAKTRVYLLRLKQMLRAEIRAKDQSIEANFNCALFSLSNSFELATIDNSDKVYVQEKKEISEFAYRFLEFLSSENNQIPVFKKRDEQEKKKFALWHDGHKGIIENLSNLTKIKDGLKLSCLSLSEAEKTSENHKNALIKKIDNFIISIEGHIDGMIDYIDGLPDILFDD